MTHTLINPNLYPDHQDLIPFVNGKLRLTSLKVTRIESHTGNKNPFTWNTKQGIDQHYYDDVEHEKLMKLKKTYDRQEKINSIL